MCVSSDDRRPDRSEAEWRGLASTACCQWFREGLSAAPRYARLRSRRREIGMEKFTKVTGVAAPLMRQNVDTDLVIRIERLVNNTGRQGLGPYCFEQIRFKPDGSENPDCVFNQEPYRDAPIILSKENFGCGSSREGAVWALAGMGVK